MAGFWLGKTRNMLASAKAEMQQELQAEEMRQILKEQAGGEEIKTLIEDSSDVVSDIKTTLKSLPEEPK